MDWIDIDNKTSATRRFTLQYSVTPDSALNKTSVGIRFRMESIIDDAGIPSGITNHENYRYIFKIRGAEGNDGWVEFEEDKIYGSGGSSSTSRITTITVAHDEDRRGSFEISAKIFDIIDVIFAERTIDLPQIDLPPPKAWIEAIDTSGNSIPLPYPAVGSGGVTINTMVDGGRNANGDFLGTVIGEDKLCYEISFASLEPIEYEKFLGIFNRNGGGRFVNTYSVFDPRKNEFVEMKMYVGDRSGRPLQLDKNAMPTRWMDVKATLIEV